MNKEEKTNKKSKKKISGITLIALVITIIVLLILAGVSIATLTGQNGILTRANNAKGRTKEEEARERAKMLVASSFDENGYFDLDIFKSELEKEGGSIVTEDEDQIVVQIGDYEVTIDIATGKIENFESSKGVRPQISTKFYTEEGGELQEDQNYEKVIVTVFIDNQDDIEKIDSVTVVDETGAEIIEEANVIGDGYASYKVSVGGSITITVKATTDGVQKTATKKMEIIIAPVQWEVTSKTDNEWYSYDGNAKINAPKLLGEMTPIKYTGEIEENQNKWANAKTNDGSMFVWIPRFAYRITEGYQTGTAGKIEVAFIDKDNNFINNDSDGKPITADPSEVTYTEKVQDQWLVHPAFTSDASIGGGFGEAGKGIEGFWVGKFEATGTYDSETETGTLSVKPGIKALVSMTINQQFKLAKSSQFGESASTEELGSHMAKNSEWGAVAYLAHSKYGCGKQISQNTASSCITGGSNDKVTIYTKNSNQSTTYNATGVYDMVGGAYEYVASYANNGSSYLTAKGGDQPGDLCDNTGTARAKSTAYKTVYGTSYSSSQSMKGDAIYETSSGNGGNYSWFGASAYFPISANPFFDRGGDWTTSGAGAFCFSNYDGIGYASYSFRVCLARGRGTLML